MAAGHPLTARPGREVLREGGNAVDAAVAAMLTSFVGRAAAHGLGAGGYMMVAGGGREPALLDFFVEAPARAATAPRRSSGDRRLLRGRRAGFHIGPASCGSTAPRRASARRCGAGARFRWRARGAAARLAREGVVLNAGQAYVAEILADLLTSIDVLAECLAALAVEDDDAHGALEADEEIVLSALVVVQAADHALTREHHVRLAHRLREERRPHELHEPAAIVGVALQRNPRHRNGHCLFAPLARTKSLTA